MQIDLGPLLGLIAMTRPFCGAGLQVSLYVAGRHMAYYRSELNLTVRRTIERCGLRRPVHHALHEHRSAHAGNGSI